MPKLPTTFTSLDLTGFEIDKTVRYNSVSREMVDKACAVLQANRIRIAVRSVRSALIEMYGLGGDNQSLCGFLRDWRAVNLAAIKDGKGDKDLISAILESSSDDFLDESEIPEEVLALSKQQAIMLYSFAHQKADTTIAGDRMKSLADENDLLKSQLAGLPQMEFELKFYKEQYEAKEAALKEAYININKQKLADSGEYQTQLQLLQTERNELIAKNNELSRQVSEMAGFQGKSAERDAEIARLNGALEARERETFAMREQIQILQAESGQKSVVESQLTAAQTQLKEANESITRLQAQIQEKSNSELQVDVDVDSLNSEIRELTDERDNLKLRVEELESQVAKKGSKPQKPQRETVAA